ncbi:copper resistance domain-containing protein [Listeria seeligeri FSL S4-171]|nr:copper resistance domain-containing protein [Listeria seeligeri FSL S4-171]
MFIYLLVLPTEFVSAHAYLENSNPADQSHIQTAPKKVTLVFNEEIEADFPLIEVKNSKGEQMKTGKTSVSKKNNHIVETTLPDDLEPDVYAVSWRVVSADGHAVSGVLSFKLGDTKATFQAELVNEKQYFAEGLYINQTGKWEVTVHGLTKDFTDINQTFTINIKQ